MKVMTIAIDSIKIINEFCALAQKTKNKVYVSKGRQSVEGSSLMGLFSIDMSTGVDVEYNEEDTEFEKFISLYKVEN